MNKGMLSLSGMLLLTVSVTAVQVRAEGIFSKDTQPEGTITFESGDGSITPPVDPENPDPTDPVAPVDPPDPGTGGALSIDYGSKFKFGVQKISTLDQTYYAAPDEMQDGSKKPTYVQITDKRGTLEGWKLSIAQPEQFKTADGDELTGAQLTFTKCEVISLVDPKFTPGTVSSEIVLTPGQTSALAVNAEQETGVGTWVYRFGSNAEANEDAVQLFVPGKSVKLARQYATRLVWSLENTPNND